MRQVLTYPDLPPVLTQAAGDLRYLPLSHAPGTDPHNQYLNNSRGDTRYSLLAHNHDASYLTPATAVSTYVPLVGGSVMTGSLSPTTTNAIDLGTTALRWRKAWAVDADLSGSLLTTNNVGVGYALGTVAAQKMLRVGHMTTVIGYDSPGGSEFLDNSYYDGTKYTPAIANRIATRLKMVNGTFIIANAPAVAAGGTQVYTDRLAMNAAGNLGVGATLATWDSNWRGVQAGNWATLSSTVSVSPWSLLSHNSYSGAGGPQAIVTGTGSRLFLNGNTISLENAPSVSTNAVQTFTPRLTIAPDGKVTLSSASPGVSLDANQGIEATYFGAKPPSSEFRAYDRGAGQSLNYHSWFRQDGQMQLYDSVGSKLPFKIDGTGGVNIAISNGGAFGIGGGPVANTIQLTSANGAMYIFAGGGLVLPQSDNVFAFGNGTTRWNTIYAAVGTINTSLYEAKSDFAPLDPALCADAVLSTDWVAFRFLPPQYAEPPEQEGQAPEERSRQVDEGRVAHARMVVETAPSRDQKGYVLKSPVHKTHDLFGLSDRASASPGSDLAVVACALQGALKRIATLETHILQLEARA